MSNDFLFFKICSLQVGTVYKLIFNMQKEIVQMVMTLINDPLHHIIPIALHFAILT